MKTRIFSAFQAQTLLVCQLTAQAQPNSSLSSNFVRTWPDLSFMGKNVSQLSSEKSHLGRHRLWCDQSWVLYIKIFISLQVFVRIFSWVIWIFSISLTVGPREPNLCLVTFDFLSHLACVYFSLVSPHVSAPCVTNHICQAAPGRAQGLNYPRDHWSCPPFIQILEF